MRTNLLRGWHTTILHQMLMLRLLLRCGIIRRRSTGAVITSWWHSISVHHSSWAISIVAAHMLLLDILLWRRVVSMVHLLLRMNHATLVLVMLLVLLLHHRVIENISVSVLTVVVKLMLMHCSIIAITLWWRTISWSYIYSSCFLLLLALDFVYNFFEECDELLFHAASLFTISTNQRG